MSKLRRRIALRSAARKEEIRPAARKEEIRLAARSSASVLTRNAAGKVNVASVTPAKRMAAANRADVAKKDHVPS